MVDTATKWSAGGLLAERLDDPGARRVRIGLGLERREGLRTNDDQRLGRLDAADQIVELRAIDVGHEVRRDSAAPLVPQSVADQQGAEVRAADANIDDMFERPAGRAALLPRRTAPTNFESWARVSRTSA